MKNDPFLIVLSIFEVQNERYLNKRIIKEKNTENDNKFNSYFISLQWLQILFTVLCSRRLKSKSKSILYR